jgi:hypothetical protein
MTRLPLVATWILPVLFTGLVLTLSAANRSGELRQPMQLSGSEVSLFNPPDGRASSLSLVWTHGIEPPSRGVRDLPRRGFAVLAMTAESGIESRLTVVDIGDDADALAARYPDGRTHVIAAATIRGTRVVDLQPSRITIPARLAAQLPPSAWRTARAPATAVTVIVQYGSRHEPWLVDISPREAP